MDINDNEIEEKTNRYNVTYKRITLLFISFMFI